MIVLSTGRAGSTLLQKLLNTHPELVIFGEHAGFLNALKAAWLTVARCEWIPEDEARGRWLLESDRPLNPERWTAWDGSFSQQDFSRGVRELLDKLFAERVGEGRRWGFKEIRYSQTEVLDFLIAIYPEAQFILLLRDPVDSCVSFASAAVQNERASLEDYGAWVARFADNQVKPFFLFYQEAASRLGERARTVFFERVTASPYATVAELGEFLRLGAPFDEAAVAKIARQDIVSQRKRSPPEQLDGLRKLASAVLAAEAGWYADALRATQREAVGDLP
ncbi:MAG: sulfotransferase family protein [Thermoanaerobaculia bacterium]